VFIIEIEFLEEPARTPPLESPKPLPSRTQKGVMSRPLPTPELDSDRNQTFRLIIQNGITKDQTENFLQYRQFYYSIWGKVVKIFRILEKLMTNYLVPIALVNGERYGYFYSNSLKIVYIHSVAELAQCTEIGRKPSLEELLSTIINRDEVEKLIKQPVKKYLLYSLLQISIC
jgi:hypothetical protein